MICANCGLPTGSSHRTHNDLKECVEKAKAAILMLARYRLLDGKEDRMSEDLRTKSLEIAMKVYHAQVHDAMTDVREEEEDNAQS